MVLAQLDLVVFQRFAQVFVLLCLFEAVEYLQQVDGNGEYLPSCLENLLVLLIKVLHFLFQIELLLCFFVVAFEELHDAGQVFLLAGWLNLGFALNFLLHRFRFGLGLKAVHGLMHSAISQVLPNVVLDFRVNGLLLLILHLHVLVQSEPMPQNIEIV